MLKEILIVGCGGFIGTVGRYLLGRCTAAMWHGAFPLGTFAANILGCFLIGLFFGLMEHTRTLSPQLSLLLITGFCGGFTTFSTFAADLCRLGQKGDWLTAALYLALTVTLGILSLLTARALVK